MSIDHSDAALRIFEAGRRHVLTRLRDAFAHQIGANAELGEVDPHVLDRLINEAADRAGQALWKISLAEGAVEVFGVSLAEAVVHPAVAAAEGLVDAPAEPIPSPSVSGDPAESAEAAAPAEEVHAAPAPPVEVPDEIPAEWDPSGETAPAPSDAWGAPVEEADSSTAPAEPAGADITPPAEPATAAEPMAAAEALPADTADTADVDTAAHVTPEAAPAAVEDTAADTAVDGVAASSLAATPDALRVPAVHTNGIESLKPGDKDIELRLSDAGLDVIKRSSGAAIGRLNWGEVTNVELEEAKRGLRGRRVNRALVVRTARGEASFDLPGLTEEESSAHLAPLLDRLRQSGRLAAAE